MPREAECLTVLGTPNRDRVAERREATRREILDAAWAVAREQGLAQLTLREVAARVGMRAPSLYSHFASKNAIYDAMFAEAWTQYLRELSRTPRRRDARHARALRASARTVLRLRGRRPRPPPADEPAHDPRLRADARRPTPRGARRSTLFRAQLAALGVTRDEDVDLCMALIGGLIDAQLANDPGGDRWGRLVDRAVDMFADNAGPPTDDEEERP